MGTKQSKQTVCNGKYSFDMDKILGQGSFGTVYRGQGKAPNKVVAIKQCVINARSMKRGKVEVDVYKEIAVIGKLPHHPHIVKLLDSDIKLKTYYLVTEFCNGGTLCEYMQKNPLDVAGMVPFMVQVCDAVTFLHAQKPPVVHRDIKPDNILIHTQKKDAVCKLADFGLARAIDGTKSYLDIKGGTTAFMAPEQFQAKPHVSEHSDVFSLGLVFQTMIEFKPASHEMMPYTEHAGNSKPVGEQVLEALEKGGKVPRIILHISGETALCGAIKYLIQRMTSPAQKSRISAAKAFEQAKLIDKKKSKPAELRDMNREAESDDTLKAEASGSTHSSGFGSSGSDSKGYITIVKQPSESPESDSSEDEEEGYSRMRELLEDQLREEFSGTMARRAPDVPLIAVLMGLMAESGRSQNFNEGDVVKVTDDADKVKALQFREGSRAANVAKYLGKEGVVQKYDDGKVAVKFQDGKVVEINGLLLSMKQIRGAEQGRRKREEKFKENDLVRIKVTLEELKSLQKEHGGFDDRMARCLETRGIVHRTDNDGDILVEFLDNTKFFLNPDALELVDLSNLPLESGDLVLILPIAVDVEKDNWEAEMGECLGHTGIVRRAGDAGGVRVETGSATWVWKKEGLRLVAKAEEMMEVILAKRLQNLFS